MRYRFYIVFWINRDLIIYLFVIIVIDSYYCLFCLLINCYLSKCSKYRRDRGYDGYGSEKV